MIRYMKRILTGFAAFALSVSAASAEITVGGKNFTEQLLMAEMTTQLLEAKGFDVNKSDGMGSTVLRKAQVNGQVDVYWEYTGTSLVTYNKASAEGLSPEQTINKVRKLDKKQGLTWLNCSDANNTYALAVKEGADNTGDIKTLSDLAAAYGEGRELMMAVNAEFPHREDGLIGLEKEYDFRVPRPMRAPMDSGLTYSALNEDEADIALVFATDGRIEAFDFRLLEDDKGFFPNYALCPVVRSDTLKENPKLRGPLNRLASKLDDATMQRLNARVDVDKVEIRKVAREFLKEQGLI
ncbi:glycine betaine ABC transporter substrate-binding protein [Halofilum ochraceum]|uniref:glycine betaine ABC transporter substrate-binding protein n=1 Tax=Halofilum ochraceum TaxID=1611323 RepID=UPI0008D9B280|nr:glycine betaine ABC transporter substrate-binding protein [Halofilum ochraceum]